MNSTNWRSKQLLLEFLGYNLATINAAHQYLSKLVTLMWGVNQAWYYRIICLALLIIGKRSKLDAHPLFNLVAVRLSVVRQICCSIFRPPPYSQGLLPSFLFSFKLPLHEPRFWEDIFLCVFWRYAVAVKGIAVVVLYNVM